MLFKRLPQMYVNNSVHIYQQKIAAKCLSAINQDALPYHAGAAIIG